MMSGRFWLGRFGLARSYPPGAVAFQTCQAVGRSGVVLLSFSLFCFCSFCSLLVPRLCPFPGQGPHPSDIADHHTLAPGEPASQQDGPTSSAPLVKPSPPSFPFRLPSVLFLGQRRSFPFPFSFDGLPSSPPLPPSLSPSFSFLSFLLLLLTPIIVSLLPSLTHSVAFSASSHLRRSRQHRA